MKQTNKLEAVPAHRERRTDKSLRTLAQMRTACILHSQFGMTRFIGLHRPTSFPPSFSVSTCAFLRIVHTRAPLPIRVYIYIYIDSFAVDFEENLIRTSKSFWIAKKEKKKKKSVRKKVYIGIYRRYGDIKRWRVKKKRNDDFSIII